MSQNFTPPAPDSYTPVAAPAPVRTGNFGLAVLAAVGTALVAGAAYGGIMSAISFQIGYLAAGVGFAVALVAVRLGGRNPVLPVLSAVLTLAGVYVGYLLDMALAVSEHEGIPVSELLTTELVNLNRFYIDNIDPISILFYAIGAYAAFQTARKSAN
ncbi:hypothetical protein ACFV0H_39125 [Streptomyces erythrochromogenes]|uniref:Integral membrane protein n=1 Tax=Streptomyces erythrochromogenes TaxID=285574 RepID=A0ABZ1QAR4_9ACTN|nr:hypothetical protein [Streptomyces erythrochromogenes]MCX5584985.1 hypothetical protein [Streptomyces erythrochromogenes]